MFLSFMFSGASTRVQIELLFLRVGLFYDNYPLRNTEQQQQDSKRQPGLRREWFSRSVCSLYKCLLTLSTFHADIMQSTTKQQPVT